MTTGWLLLLLLIVSSQSVNSQSMTVNETNGEEGRLLIQLQSDVERILENQQQLFQQQQTLLDNQQRLFERIGKS